MTPAPSADARDPVALRGAQVFAASSHADAEKIAFELRNTQAREAMNG